MQLNNIFAICVAIFAGTTIAVPHIARPYHGHGVHAVIKLPQGNSTSPQNATTTGIRPLTSGISKPETITLSQKNQRRLLSTDCPDVCKLETSTCSLAAPHDDNYCTEVYQECLKACQ